MSWAIRRTRSGYSELRISSRGAPGLGVGAQLGGFAELGQGVRAAHAVAEAEVVHGQHVGATQAIAVS